MGGKCESDKGNPVGCKLIQKMSSDIQKIKEIRHPFSGWSILIIAALVVIIAGILLASTFKSNSYPTEIRLDVQVDGGGAVSEKAKANIKLELSEALLAMEARAAAAYNEKFATLLTILTIFGIAWPLVIALLQFRFNERELNKIKLAETNANSALDRIKKIEQQSQNTLELIGKSIQTIGTVNTESIERSKMLFNSVNIAFAAMAWDKDLPRANYYYTLALMCSAWALGVSKKLGLDLIILNNMITNIKLIRCENNISEITHSTYKFLISTKNGLCKIAKVNNPQQLIKISELLQLLDEKIADYKRLGIDDKEPK